MAPSQITDGPFQVRGSDLLDININGEWHRVSPWSIKGNTYYQGCDSNFLVHRYRAGAKHG